MINDWKGRTSDTHKKDVDFSADRFRQVYVSHLQTLAEHRRKSPNRYRNTMAKIFREASYAIWTSFMDFADCSRRVNINFDKGKGRALSLDLSDDPSDD